VEGPAGRRPRQEDDGRRGPRDPAVLGHRRPAARPVGGGLRLAIVSSNSEATIRSILGAELAGLVDHYGCGAAIFGKAAKFKAVVKAARIAKDRVLCIGDETRDIEAAREAGLACGAVEWGYATRRALADHSPTMMFSAMDEIISRVAASNHGVGAD
jgi:phosphoglycolate phosphatase